MLRISALSWAWCYLPLFSARGRQQEDQKFNDHPKLNSKLKIGFGLHEILYPTQTQTTPDQNIAWHPPDMVDHACSPSTLEAEAEDCHEFKACPGCRLSPTPSNKWTPRQMFAEGMRPHCRRWFPRSSRNWRPKFSTRPLVSWWGAFETHWRVALWCIFICGKWFSGNPAALAVRIVGEKKKNGIKLSLLWFCFFLLLFIKLWNTKITKYKVFRGTREIIESNSAGFSLLSQGHFVWLLT